MKRLREGERSCRKCGADMEGRGRNAKDCGACTSSPATAPTLAPEDLERRIAELERRLRNVETAFRGAARIVNEEDA